MKKLLPFAVLLLTACTAQSHENEVIIDVTDSSDASSSSDSSTSPREEQKEDTIEQLPSELSIPHFSQMRLEGTDLTFEGVLDDNAAYTRHAISYLSNGLRITGIMNIPKGDGPFPLVILNHGFIDPSVYTQGRGLKREQDYLARQGFAILHTDYRGHAGGDPSPMTEDVYDGNLEYAMDSANAILAVREANLPNVDDERVGMMGHSLGGGVTMAVLTGKPELVDAAVLYAPVHSDVWENFMRWRRLREEGDNTLRNYGTKEEGAAWWANLSPVTFFDDVRAPVLLFHGDRDESVPKSWSDFLNEQLATRGKAVTYVEYTGETHEFVPQWNDFMQKTAAFFSEHLKTPS